MDRMGYLGGSECWRPVRGFESAYEVSDLGRVRGITRPVRGRSGLPSRVKGRILRPWLNNNGYKTLKLCAGRVKTRVFVHQLVAKAFVANPKNLPVVNHLDGAKHRNVPDNLEWTTNSGNLSHAYATGLRNQKGQNGSQRTATR